ncbi:LysR family transcriptional regulator [Saccharopolyspora sp. NPDC050389]|uniref:LysR family transcriptional regulator n=1 Tax=Saccharopolyspora sp. NPDC050389 TaxID=3155516 RepID=UPI0034000699
MDRRQLEVFLAVVEYGSMSRAALNLGVSQPSVSQTVRALERQVGSKLFDRQASRLELTQAGAALVGPARRIMREFAAAAKAVAGIVDVRAGRLDLAVPGILARFPLVSILTAFSTTYPLVLVRVEDQTTVTGVRDAVTTGRAEIGFVTTLEDPAMRAVLLGRHTLKAVYPPGTPDPGRPVGPADIAARSWISGLPLGFQTRLTLQQVMARSGHVLKPRIQTAHRQAIPQLVLSGVGPAMLIAEEAAELAAFGAVVRDMQRQGHSRRTDSE